MKKNYLSQSVAATLIFSIFAPNFASAAGGVSPQAIAASQKRVQEQHKASLKTGEALMNSPFEECKDVNGNVLTFLTQKDYEQDKSYWDAAKDCEGIKIEVIADTGFFNTMVQTLKGDMGMDSWDDATLKRAKDFLYEVGNKSSSYAKANRERSQKIAGCKGKVANEECKAMVAETKAQLMALLPSFRRELALSTNDTQQTNARGGSSAARYSIDKNPEKFLNVKLKAVNGLPTANDSFLSGLGFNAIGSKQVIEPLTKEEIAQAIATYKEDATKIVAEKSAPNSYDNYINKNYTLGTWNLTAPTRASFDKTKNQVLSNDRLFKQSEHIENAKNLINQVPLLSYIKSRNPSDEEIMAAAEMFARNAKEVEEQINKAMKDAKSEGKYSASMGDFIRYTPVVKEILKNASPDKKASLCGTATMLTQYRSSRDLDENISKGLVAVAGAVLTGGAGAAIAVETGGLIGTGTAAAVGSALGTGAIYVNDWQRATDAQKRLNTSMENTSGKTQSLADVKEYNEALDSVKMDLLFSPLDFLGVGRIAAPEKAKIIKDLLMKTGKVTEANAARLSANVVKANSNEAKLALVEIQKTLKDSLSPSKKKFMELAAGKKWAVMDKASGAGQKGLSHNEIFDRAIKATDAQVDKAMNAYKDIAGKGVIRPDNDKEIMGTLLSASRLVGDDPDKMRLVAGKAVDWNESPESLVGLQVTLDKAKVHYDDPNFAKGKSPQERLEESFRQGLKDQGVEDPNQIKQMSACGIGSKI